MDALTASDGAFAVALALVVEILAVSCCPVPEDELHAYSSLTYSSHKRHIICR